MRLHHRVVTLLDGFHIRVEIDMRVVAAKEHAVVPQTDPALCLDGLLSLVGDDGIRFEQLVIANHLYITDQQGDGFVVYIRLVRGHVGGPRDTASILDVGTRRDKQPGSPHNAQFCACTGGASHSKPADSKTTAPALGGEYVRSRIGSLFLSG